MWVNIFEEENKIIEDKIIYQNWATKIKDVHNKWHIGDALKMKPELDVYKV